MNNARDCSVIAVFSNQDDARAARAELHTAGFHDDRVFSSVEPPAGVAPTRPENPFTHWLKSLFGGGEHEHLASYRRALESGQFVVGVDTSDEDAPTASGILARFSPINVHTDDFGAAHGIATSDTGSGGSQSSASDYLNARDELNSVRVYPRSDSGTPATRL